MEIPPHRIEPRQAWRRFLTSLDVIGTLLGAKAATEGNSERNSSRPSPPSEEETKEYRRYDIEDLLLP